MTKIFRNDALGSLTEMERTYIEKTIVDPAEQPFVIGSILKTRAVFEPVDEWLGDWAGFAWEKSNEANISFDDYENAQELSPSWVTKTGSGFALSGKIVMSPTQLSYCRRQAYGVNVGFDEIIGHQLKDFQRQIEAVYACGDASQLGDTSKPNWKSTGSSVFPGLVNGTSGTHMTTIVGGRANSVNTNGDFMKTFNAAEKAFQNGGIDTKNVNVVMDLDTMHVFKDSRHSTSGAYELPEVKASFPSWSIDVDNYILEKGAESTHRMVFIQPFDNGSQKKLKYKVARELHVQPVGGGTIQSSGKFEWFIGWKGGPLALDALCVLRTGSLTIA
jgi:hypothetical protein